MFDIRRPCIKQCCLDDNDVCMGCFRTLDDMGIWHKSSDIQKLDMLRGAHQRKEEYKKKKIEKKNK